MRPTRIAVYTDHCGTGTELIVVHQLPNETTPSTIVRVLKEFWKWDDWNITRCLSEVKTIELDDKLWESVCTKVKWPTADRYNRGPDSPRQEIEDMITRCKIAVYKACGKE
jgi:hypothetical protein